GRRARGDRQHRVGRGLRGPDRPGRLFGVQGRRGRHDPADGPRAGALRHPGDDHRPGRVLDPDGRRHARQRAGIAGRLDPLPFAPGQAGGVRLAGRVHPRQQLPQRRDHSPRRRDAAGAEVTMKAYDIKKCNVVEHNGTVYQVRDIERSAPQGRGGNVKFRFTLYSVPGGNKLDLSLGGDDELKEVELSRRQATYSYRDGDAFVFLDDEDYTPYTLDADVVGDAAGYIVDDLSGCYVQLIDEAPVALQLPQSVAIEVVETPPELKGGTATKRPKPAKLATGIEILVPEYIASGEKVWVNTTTGEFAGRADGTFPPLWERALRAIAPKGRSHTVATRASLLQFAAVALLPERRVLDAQRLRVEAQFAAGLALPLVVAQRGQRRPLQDHDRHQVEPGHQA